MPAAELYLAPVDQVFVRMGARDHIMAGQSTFLVELQETATMLVSCTCYEGILALFVHIPSTGRRT